MNNEELSEELKTLARIELLLKTLVKVALGEKLDKVFLDKNYRFIYEHTGRLPIKEIAKRTGLGAGTISRLWNLWEREGLLVKAGKSYHPVL